ncbi:MAG: hypothetical protein J5858_02005 [Lentisphaeria bacterium]|nr:hypothetical protein [Lentisphaeria bacterium]
MNEIIAIASGTWKNILRMKVVYFLIFCVWVLVGIASMYEVLTIGHHKPLMMDVSLVLNSIAAALVVLSVTFEIPRELRQGVAATLLTKSLGRTQYLAGKAVGIFVAGGVICILIAAGSFLIYSQTFSESIALSMFQAQIMLIISIIPMSAMAVFFATLFPEVVAPVLTILAIWFAYSTGVLAHIPVLYGGLLPNLDFFNFKSHAVYLAPIPGKYMLMATLWGIAYALFLLMFTSFFFKAKDIK